MTATRAFSTFVNIVFTIAIWFAVPIVMPVAATLAWVLIILNFFFSLGIALLIPTYYREQTK